MYETGTNLLVCLFLAVNARSDIRQRQIWLPLSALVLTAGLMIHAALPERFVMESIAGLIPGGILFLLGRLIPGGVGLGDIAVICACGAVLGMVRTFELSTFGLFLAAGWALFLLAGKGAKKRQTIPFLPFLFAAQIILLIARWIYEP